MELTFDGLVKNYDTVKALKGVSFTLTPGVNGLLGPNGAGKSTIVKLLLRFYDVTEGAVYVGGRNVKEKLISRKDNKKLIQSIRAIT